MAIMPERLNAEISETELMVEEFRQKVVASLKKEREKLRDTAEREAKLILTKAYQDAASVNSKSQEEARQILARSKEQADREAEALITQTQIKVEQIVKNAEEITRKEAKDRTKKEVDSIINTAREESSKSAARILQTAKEESSSLILKAKNESSLISNKMISDAKIEAAEVTKTANELKQKATKELEDAQKKAEETIQKILVDIRESAQNKAEREAAEIVAQARMSAQKERESLLAAAVADGKRTAEIEASQILMNARQEAEDIIDAAKDKVRVQLEDSSRLMLEIQQKMQQVIGTAGLDIKIKSTADIKPQPIMPPPSPPKRVEEKPIPESRFEPRPEPKPESKPVYTPAREQNVRQEDYIQANSSSSLGNDGNPVYQGRLKIDIAPPVDIDQLNNLEHNLQKTPNVQVIVKGGTEDGSAWIEIELSKPTSLLDILRKLPGVKDVVGAKSYIIVALRSKQLV